MPAKFSSERFVGRERELSHLAVALEAATDGRSPRLLVSGRGGVGVSRLVTEAERRVGGLSEPFQVIRCRAVPLWMTDEATTEAMVSAALAIVERDHG